MTEQQALARLREKDPAGLDWFIRRYTPYVGTVIWNVIGRAMTRQDAEELCSDVFLALWQNGQKPLPGKVKSYLGVIARRKAVNALRERGGVELGTEEDMLVLPAAGPEGTVEARELARQVKAAVESLDPTDREIFVRFYYYCQTTARIGEETGLSPANVRKGLERGRVRLRTYFRDKEEYDALYDFL